ncbi:hypothetical protein G7046_g6900 [Stylonectria norvegica]|nr:hypothetical protein G7046_g6900 [Stylonectria norvegica]
MVEFYVLETLEFFSKYSSKLEGLAIVVGCSVPTAVTCEGHHMRDQNGELLTFPFESATEDDLSHIGDYTDEVHRLRIGLDQDNRQLVPEAVKSAEHWRTARKAETTPCAALKLCTPGPPSISKYNFIWFFNDLIASIIIGSVIAPKSMACDLLAKLPVEYGLYTSFMGVLNEVRGISRSSILIDLDPDDERRLTRCLAHQRPATGREAADKSFHGISSPDGHNRCSCSALIPSGEQNDDYPCYYVVHTRLDVGLERKLEGNWGPLVLVGHELRQAYGTAV